MRKKNIFCLAFLVSVVSGCAEPEQITSPSDSSLGAPEHGAPETATAAERPSAIEILKHRGLMTKDDYVSADFIPNSNDTMIVAEMRHAPCKMIFSYVITENSDYWMPNQIACAP